MIYLDVFGRLGNNLFQLFAARSLNPAAEIRLIYHKVRGYQPDFGGQLDSYGSKVQAIAPTQVLRHVPRYINYDKGYIPIPLTDGIHLSGYFQSYKYLDRQLVLEHFRQEESAEAALLSKYGLVQPYSFMSVRRGDFLEEGLSCFFNLCDLDYYMEALEALSPHGQIAVCSDDIEWCKAVFKHRQFVFIDRSTPLEQLFVMSMASAGICANSTFSWWGAYLMRNPDKVIVPDVWVHYDASDQWKAKDMCPPEWLVINNIK